MSVLSRSTTIWPSSLAVRSPRLLIRTQNITNWAFFNVAVARKTIINASCKISNRIFQISMWLLNIFPLYTLYIRMYYIYSWNTCTHTHQKRRRWQQSTRIETTLRHIIETFYAKADWQQSSSMSNDEIGGGARPGIPCIHRSLCDSWA